VPSIVDRGVVTIVGLNGLVATVSPGPAAGITGAAAAEVTRESTPERASNEKTLRIGDSDDSRSIPI